MSVVKSEDLLAYIKAMPGSTAGDVAKFFGSNKKQMGERLTLLEKRGCVRFVGAAYSDPYKWYVTGKDFNAQRPGCEWPEEQKQKLREMYAVAPWGDMIREFYPKTRAAIAERARAMKLKRPRNIGRENGKASIHKMREALLEKTRLRHEEEDRIHIRVVRAIEADKNIVAKAIAKRTPLEEVWCQL